MSSRLQWISIAVVPSIRQVQDMGELDIDMSTLFVPSSEVIHSARVFQPKKEKEKKRG
jgi:hypothetical protein